MIIDGDATIRVLFVKDLLESFVGELIPVLELTIVFGVFLYGIIGQMHVLIIYVW